MFNFIRRYVKRNYGIDKEYYRFIDDMFGFIPNNIELYKVALIHKSASQSVGGHHINNERLEYLGDAVIESITSDYLFIAYPDRDEGFLTQTRSKLVSRQSLNEMAVFIGLDKYLICKNGATLQQKHIYGDAFEAMIGAIYLDQGYDFTNRLLINDIFERFRSLDEVSEEENDFKSRLIEWCQKNRHTLEYKTTKTTDKKNGAPVFFTTVLIDNIEMGHGIGDSKKTSEQNASCSVTREMSDEECAKLLDKVDKMMTKIDQPQQPQQQPQQQKKATEKRREAVAEGEEAAEGQQHREHKHKQNRHKHQQPQSAEPQPAPESEPRAEVDITAAMPEAEAEKTADDQPAKRRRGRRKKTDGTAAEPQQEVQKEQKVDAVEVSADNNTQDYLFDYFRLEVEAAEVSADNGTQGEPVEAEQPAKRRRTRRKKAETTETAAAAEPQQSEATQAAETTKTAEAADETQPSAKRRRGGRRRKSDAESAEQTDITAAAHTADTTGTSEQ